MGSAKEGDAHLLNLLSLVKPTAHCAPLVQELSRAWRNLQQLEREGKRERHSRKIPLLLRTVDTAEKWDHGRGVPPSCKAQQGTDDTGVP